MNLKVHLRDYWFCQKLLGFCWAKAINTLALTYIFLIYSDVHISFKAVSFQSRLVYPLTSHRLTSNFYVCCLILTSSGKFRFKILCFPTNSFTFRVSPSNFYHIFFSLSLLPVFFNYLDKFFDSVVVNLFLPFCPCLWSDSFCFFLILFAPSRSFPCLIHPHPGLSHHSFPSWRQCFLNRSLIPAKGLGGLWWEKTLQ